MDNAQVEHELGELELKLERLRALYEQYFLGLEKLEPRVLRKEVDRIFWTLRREQVRNTGLRFKFQMLIQRYNTYQQYWTRVVREIESGTYRRDIIKVAKRFGEQDALTILGKKRAEQYKRLAVNQEARRDRRKGAADASATAEAGGAGASEAMDEAPVSIAPDDVELMEDDDADRSVTPLRPMPPVRTQAEPDMESLLQLATVGVKTWGARPNVEGAAAPSPATEPPKQAAKAQSAPPAESARVGAPTANAAPMITTGAPVSAKSAPVSSKSGPVITMSAPAKAASPAAAPAPLSGKSRVAELAAQMRAKKQDAAKPRADELDDLFEAPSAPKPAAVAPSKPGLAPLSPAATAPAKPDLAPAPAVTAPPRTGPSPVSPAAARAPDPAPNLSTPATSQPQRAPATTTPLPKPAPTAATPVRAPATTTTALPKPAPTAATPVRAPAATTTPLPKPAPTAATPVRAPAATTTPLPKPAPATTTPFPKPAPAPSGAAAREDLSEQKMREIYGKYVGAKRAANESTAGITYDKLATSLRAQADKLKTSHPSKSVDFEIVTKDGKTALRPVVK